MGSATSYTKDTIDTNVIARSWYSFTDPAIGGVGDGTTDNTTAFNTAMGLLTAGGELFFPAGVYLINGITDIVPGGTTLVGTGWDYADTTDPVEYASVIKAGAIMDRLIQLGADGNGTISDAGTTGASLRNLSLTGDDKAVTVVKTAARRNYIVDCQIYRGSSQAVWIHGQNSYISGGRSVIAQNDTGDCILVDNYYDHKIFDAQIRQPGTTGAAIRLAGNIQDITISRCHMWAGGNGVGSTAQGLIVLSPGTSNTVADVNIAENIIEGIIGPEIVLDGSGTGSTIRGVTIGLNKFFNNDSDNTHPVISLVGPGTIGDVTVGPNTMNGHAATTGQYSAILAYSGSPACSGFIVDNNVGSFVAAATSGTLPTELPVFGHNTFRNGAAGVKRTRYRGLSTQTGDGTKTSFSTAHGLFAIPTSVSVTPNTQSAGTGPWWVEWDATQIVLKFVTAPANASTIKFAWSAEM